MNLCHMGFTSTYEPESKVVNYKGCMFASAETAGCGRFLCINSLTEI